MGQQPSKRSGGGENGNSARDSTTLPIIKSDTQGSSRSLRGSIRKIKDRRDKNNNDDESPTASAAAFLAAADKKDDADASKSTSGTRIRANSLPTTAGPIQPVSEPTTPITEFETSPIPPPSPIHSGSIGKGHHALDNGNIQEVDQVSDAPVGSGPAGATHHNSSQMPKESILIRRPNAPNPVSNMMSGMSDGNGIVGTPDGMQMSALKSIDLDDMISRLLDAGYAGKVTKAVCLKNAEIQAICMAAREVFLSQPALIELSAPVKIVGDVHGQYTDLIRMFEMCGFPPNSNYLFLGNLSL